jgi:hypothetical protein
MMNAIRTHLSKLIDQNLVQLDAKSTVPVRVAILHQNMSKRKYQTRPIPDNIKTGKATAFSTGGRSSLRFLKYFGEREFQNPGLLIR